MSKTRLGIPILFGALVLFGCEPKDRQELADVATHTAHQGGKALQQAWASLNDKLANMDDKSTRDDIEQAKKELSQIERKAEKGARSDWEAARLEIDRLNAAEKVQDLEKEVSDAWDKAKAEEQDAERNVADAKEKAKDAQDRASALQKDLDSAKDLYQTAATKAQSAWDGISR